MWQSKERFSSGEGYFFYLVKKLDNDEDMIKVTVFNL